MDLQAQSASQEATSSSPNASLPYSCSTSPPSLLPSKGSPSSPLLISFINISLFIQLAFVSIDTQCVGLVKPSVRQSFRQTQAGSSNLGQTLAAATCLRNSCYVAVAELGVKDRKTEVNPIKAIYCNEKNNTFTKT